VCVRFSYLNEFFESWFGGLQILEGLHGLVVSIDVGSIYVQFFCLYEICMQLLTPNKEKKREDQIWSQTQQQQQTYQSNVDGGHVVEGVPVVHGMSKFVQQVAMNFYDFDDIGE